MNAAVAQGDRGRPGGVGERERLGATLVLSLLVHGMVILGVGFALNEAAPVLPTLDVILTEASTALITAKAMAAIHRFVMAAKNVSCHA